MTDTATPDTNAAKRSEKVFYPTLHFRSENVIIGEADSTPVQVCEFVRAGQLLADYGSIPQSLLKKAEKAPMEAGANTYWNEGFTAIISALPGYPKIKKMRRKDVKEMVTIVELEPLIKVTPDKMQATLSIHPPIPGRHQLKNEEIEQLLANQGICYGLDEQALEDSIELIKQEKAEFHKYVIARGRPVGQSTDAYLEFALEIGPIAGTLLPDGSIDYRERKIMVGIEAGEKIATKIPAVQGEPGINIYGEETPARKGNDIKIELLNDCTYSSASLTVTATKSGVLSIVNSRIIKVCSHQVIPRDIDYVTGNVDSENSVTIHGTVQPSFKVRTVGDLKITGSISSGILTCGGNLVIQGGIIGKNSTIKVAGDADIKFIEQGELQCGGIIVVRRQCYYSELRAGADIRFQPSCKMMGGKLIAGGSLSLGAIGSENASPAVIAAGVVPERFDLLTELKQSLLDQQEAIVQWLQRFRGTALSRKIRRMEEELSDTKLRLIRLNLIPGTGLYSRAGIPDDLDMDADLTPYCDDNAIDMQKICIDVAGTIYAGTEIRIGNRTLRLDSTVSSRRFSLHSSGKRIQVNPI